MRIVSARLFRMVLPCVVLVAAGTANADEFDGVSRSAR